MQAQVKARAEAAAEAGTAPEGWGGAGAVPAGSPADTIAAAAQAMSEALRTALALVEHSNAQSLPKYERRADFHRRAADVLIDHVKYD